MKMRLLLLAVLPLALVGCRDNVVTQVQPLPFNPYDTLDYDHNVVPSVPIDSNTFLGIHQYILRTKCAQPACHDGSFEPDYRTVMSAYNTLVYAPVEKNDDQNSFTYRVKPFDTTLSWLHERITTDDPVLGKMPLYDSLPQRQINMISNWIQAGAKDIFGNTPGLPNPQPAFYGIVAYMTANNMRVDTMRGGFFLNPFMVPANTQLTIWFGLFDEDIAHTIALFGAPNKVKFSTDPLNFDNAPFVSLSFSSQAFPSYAIDGSPADYYLYANVNTSQFNPGDVVYMRAYAKDADHPNYTEIPSASSPQYLKTYFAFVVQ